MPQDSITTGTNTADYYTSQPGMDSLNQVIIQQSTQLSGENDFQKKSDEYSSYAPLYTFLLLAGIWIIIKIRDGNNNGYVEIGSSSNDDTFELEPEEENKDYLCYDGSAIGLTDDDLKEILEKRFPYYTALNWPEKDKFIHRISKFISRKTFKIHDKSGFKEMPVLISAAAIQLSLGLEKYLLPDFPFINIYPQEFLGTEPTIRYLEGNVSGNSINMSWKHFLDGFQIPADGHNVGLHEMAHAYYFQNFEANNQADNDFVSTFPKFNQYGNKVFEEEHLPGNDLYSEYALKNYQEFWAESIEIFFEKPAILRSVYPGLYDAISDLLNQDPLL